MKQSVMTLHGETDPGYLVRKPGEPLMRTRGITWPGGYVGDPGVPREIVRL